MTINLHIGIIRFQCRYDQGSEEKKFIVDANGPAKLGLLSCRKPKMTTLHCEIRERTKTIRSIENPREVCHKQFKHIEHFQGKSHIITYLVEALVIHTPQKYRIYIKEGIKKNNLDKMVKDDIIRKDPGPSEWVNRKKE